MLNTMRVAYPKGPSIYSEPQPQRRSIGTAFKQLVSSIFESIRRPLHRYQYRKLAGRVTNYQGMAFYNKHLASNSLWDLTAVGKEAWCQENILGHGNADRVHTDLVVLASFYQEGILKTGELTRKEHDGLELLQSGNRAPDAQKKIERFLRYAAGNKNFNRRLRAYKSTPAERDVVKAVLEFTHKSQSAEQLIAVAGKVDRARTDISQGRVVQEKVTLQELRRLESVANLTATFDLFGGAANEVVGDLVGAARKAARVQEEILQTIEAENTTPSGSMISYTLGFQEQYLGKKSFMERFVTTKIFRTNSAHLAVAVGNNQESHMWGKPSKHKIGRRTIGNYACPSARLNFGMIVKPEHRALVETRYGENWAEVLGERYGAICTEFHNSREREGLTNPAWRRVLSAVTFNWSPFKRTWQERMQFSPHGVICSEFVLKSGLQNLETLNQELKGELGGVEGDVLSPPVRQYRRLNRYLPGAFIGMMLQTRVAIRNEHSKTLAKLVDFEPQPFIA